MCPKKFAVGNQPLVSAYRNFAFPGLHDEDFVDIFPEGSVQLVYRGVACACAAFRRYAYVALASVS